METRILAGILLAKELHQLLRQTTVLRAPRVVVLLLLLIISSSSCCCCGGVEEDGWMLDVAVVDGIINYNRGR